MRAMSREVGVVERDEQRAHFALRERVTGANAAVASHRRERQIDRVLERALTFASHLREEVAQHALRARTREELRHGVHAD